MHGYVRNQVFSDMRTKGGWLSTNEDKGWVGDGNGTTTMAGVLLAKRDG